MRFTLYVPKASCPEGMKEDTCPLCQFFANEPGVTVYKYKHSAITKRPVYKIIGDYTNKYGEAQAFKIMLQTCINCHNEHDRY